MSILSQPHFHSEKAAFAFLERVLWPNGPECPHCGEVGRAGKLKGKTTRVGLWKCYACRRSFTVKVGTVLEHGRVPLNKFLQAAYLMASSKKGISAHQLHRTLEVTYKTAWFMAHRVREAMREGKLPGGLGGQNKVVEVDETYVGGKAKNAKRGRTDPAQGAGHCAGRARRRRSVVPPAYRQPEQPSGRINDAIDRKSYLMTDDAAMYKTIGREFAGHGSVNHSIEEYVRGTFWHTNTIEGYFSILKRGITGVYQHVSQHHLKRYLGEFDFRYNGRKISNAARTEAALKGIVGKRLYYRQPA